MTKDFGKPRSSAWRRRMRTQVAWNVPTQVRRSSVARSDSTRSRISRAALFVNVKARTEPSWTPRSRTRCATRPVRTRVFPLPAPARMRRGPPGCSTAWRWTGFSSTRRSVFQSDLEVEIVFLGRPGRIRAPDLLTLQQEVPGHAVVRADLLLRLG